MSLQQKHQNIQILDIKYLNQVYFIINKGYIVYILNFNNFLRFGHKP